MAPILVTLLVCLLPVFASAADRLVLDPSSRGPGRGKHIVLVGGDEEYRSEEMLPALARLLSARYGFRCTVLFAIDKTDGSINPNQNDNIPGLDTLEKADLMVIMTRWRKLPDEQMAHFDQWLKAAKPVVGIRTATHAFKLPKGSTFEAMSSDHATGGFGRVVLGETWINHHGQHGKQGTRARIAPGEEKHPILRGIRDGEIFVPTDVYRVRLPLPGDSRPLLLGEVVDGMDASARAASGAQNEPMMPVAWTKSYGSEPSRRSGRVFTTTMGSAQDFSSAGFRRLLVNGVLWALGLESRIAAGSTVDIVGPFEPTPFGFGKFRKGVKPEDLAVAR